MVLLKDYMTNLLPDYIKREDSYKDVDGKGFIVRYLEIFGAELDEFIYNKIGNLENEFNPLSITNAGYLDYIAFLLGDLPNLTQDEDAYRRLLTHIISIYKVKGTKKSFKAILYVAGVEIEEFNEVPLSAQVYDGEDINYDDSINYDENCATCSEYDLVVSSTLTLTASLYSKILDLISLVEPVNAKLRNFTFNENSIEEVLIEVIIDENGDLVYDNAADPDLELTLTSDGDLIIEGPNANKYFLNNEGDLIYVS